MGTVLNAENVVLDSLGKASAFLSLRSSEEWQIINTEDNIQ